jgi:hypothetical protein
VKIGAALRIVIEEGRRLHGTRCVEAAILIVARRDAKA